MSRIALAMSPLLYRLGDWKAGARAIEEAGLSPDGLAVLGEDKGAQLVAEKLGIPARAFPVDWNDGTYAGMMRNIDLLHHATALVVVWLDDEPSIRHLIEQAYYFGLPVWITNYHTGLRDSIAPKAGAQCHDLFANT